MPLYEYRCGVCGAEFELLVRSNTAVVCPDCGNVSVERLISAPFISSGQTSRQAGHTCCGREERCSAPPCSEGDGCRRG
jgi:putative FmdB family regulatory protein